LLRAVESALMPGLRVGPIQSSARGSSVVLVADDAEVHVVADWLEGEAEVEVRRLDEPPVTAICLARLPRGVTEAVLRSRLSRNGERLVALLAEVR
jgi:hypothetical protein